MNPTLAEFVKYCEEHPTERFWQALRNFADQDFIFFGNVTNRRGTNAKAEYDGMKIYLDDTFNYAGRDK